MVNELIFILGFPLLRGILGWLENAAEDGYFSLLEWQELVATVIRIATPVLIVYTGVSYIGADQAITMLTAAAATIVDIAWSKFKHA